MTVQADQIQVNGLLLGTGTSYVINEFNPYQRSGRSTDTARSWSRGSWSGREDLEAVPIPLRLTIDAGDDASWLEAVQILTSALAPSSTDVELRWTIGTTEYLMNVRPRLVNPETDDVVNGRGGVACALVALDPNVYSANLKQAVTGLPSTVGGLTAPLTVPFTIDAVVTSGRLTIVNGGRQDAALTFRIDANGAQLVQPRITLQSGSTVSVLRANLTLDAEQWLTIDTAARTAYLNDTASRRGDVYGVWPVLPPGSADLAFDADTYSSVAQLTVAWRDTW